MPQSRFGKLVNVNVDWITATCRDGDSIRTLKHHAEVWLHDELQAGNECTEWSGHGYVGLHCGSVQLGQRHDGILLRVTGIEAHHKASVIMDHATNVSRIDFASTVRLKPNAKYFAEACEREARRFKKKHGMIHQIELRRNSNTGNTVYLNRRVSDRFIRIYDKGAQSRLPELEGCWRAECQYNNDLAWSKAKALARARYDLAWLHNTVYGELERKGVTWYPLLDGALEVQCDSLPVVRPSVERRLHWLSVQVAPTVKALWDRGYYDEVLQVLGLRGKVRKEKADEHSICVSGRRHN